MDNFKVFLLCLVALVQASQQSTFKMPETCKNQNMEYCFSAENYPTEIVENLLKTITNLEVANDVQVWSTEQRISTPEEDCRAKATEDPIYYIVDDQGNDRVVVQMAGRFEQRFSVTRCETEGTLSSRTFHFLKATVSEYHMSCQNKYLDLDFLVLSKEADANGVWKMERARTKSGIPVCCACRYEKNAK